MEYWANRIKYDWRPVMDENIFFREATLKICGSLDIEKALHHSLIYIRDFIPADRLSFHIYDYNTGVLETVAVARPGGGEILSVRGTMPHKVRRLIEETAEDPRVRLVDRTKSDEVTGPQARNLGWPDASGMVMGLILEGEILGVLTVTNDRGAPYLPEHIRLLELLNEPFAVALANSLSHREVNRLRDLLADDNRYFQDELRRVSGEEIIGSEYGLKQVMDLVRQVAPMASPVLLLGETGTGKEIIANAIHNSSPRRDGPFIKVNCGAIPGSLMDSELFGHEKGAFTGAISKKRGRFERAHGGTIFLDEIGELPAEAQVKLLRVLQDGSLERVGGGRPLVFDIRVIAATHRDLEEMKKNGKFREDLYFRLKVFPVVIPPLRIRSADIPSLIQHFLRKKSLEMGREIPSLAPGVMEKLMAYDWPGNVRELENAVERALILCRGGTVRFDDIEKQSAPDAGPAVGPDGGEELNLDRRIAAHITRVLEMTGGRVSGPRGAAKLMGVNPSTLRKRMNKLGIAYGKKAAGSE